MHTIKIGTIDVRILEVRRLPSPAFFSLFISLSQAEPGDLIGIERRNGDATDAGLDVLSASRVITQTSQGPEWHGLADNMADLDRARLRNSFSFHNLERIYLRDISDVPPQTPVTILNECLVTDFGDGPVCLLPHSLSRHEHLRVVSDLRSFLPAWMTKK